MRIPRNLHPSTKVQASSLPSVTMVKLKLPSPFRSDDNYNNNQGRRRSQRIQQQRLQRQQQALERLETTEESMEDFNSEVESCNDRLVPGQRRSFDDIESSSAPSGSTFRRIFSGNSNKKSKPSNSASYSNSTVAFRRAATTMFRPNSSSGRREAGTRSSSMTTEPPTIATFTTSSFDTAEGMVSDESVSLSLKHDAMDIDMANDEANVLGKMTVLEWMQTQAPPDVLPKILSFCGSRKVNALSRVNKTWNKVVKNDLVWRVMCEDTQKWSDEDKVPHSWLQHYKDNPCLPFDYDTIDAAFEAISSGSRKKTVENGVKQYFREQRTNARIILQPGPYFLRRALVCNIIGTAEVKIECVRSSDPRHGLVWSRNFHKKEDAIQQHDVYPRTHALHGRRPSSPTLMEAFGCHFPPINGSLCPFSDINDNEGGMSELIERLRSGSYSLSCIDGACPTAFLILESRRNNEPLVRVRKGAVTLRGLKFLHYAEGNDIWNGNAAIQVQGPFGPDNRPARIFPPSIVPTVNVIDCDIMSMSGRGIVSIDGGISHIDHCNIHNNAATGVYLGGVGSAATISRTDIFENGAGNGRHRDGNRSVVQRGHSGIYVEQGTIRISDCNISKNSLTGLSGISQDSATLQVVNSDLQSNGSVQLELPPIGSPSRERSYSRGNNISTLGQGRPRSRFLIEMNKKYGHGFDGPVGNHFAPLPQSPSEFPHDNVTRVPRVEVGLAAN